MSIAGEEELDVIRHARLWRDARLTYFKKSGATVPEDLTALANAEHDLMKTVSNMEIAWEESLGENYRPARKF